MQILPTKLTAAGLPEPIVQPLQLDGRPIAMPLPDDVGALRQRDNQLLIAWRFFSRDVFEQAFGGGYALVDCAKLADRGWRYILAPLK
jgi:predicted GNAT superfamily acetyltransferase